jgi:hypothetical protein
MSEDNKIRLLLAGLTWQQWSAFVREVSEGPGVGRLDDRDDRVNSDNFMENYDLTGSTGSIVSLSAPCSAR